MPTSADVVICGAGIAGASAAYHLSARGDVGRVLLIDEREPLTLTSDKGTQGYRNWWPGPDDTMLQLVSRSIDLLEESATESGNCFRLNRRGYLFATADEARLTQLEATARQVSAFGMGPLRTPADGTPYAPHTAEGFAGQPTGADLLVGGDARRAFPYLADDMIGALHVRRAGTLNAPALGAWFLKRAAAAGLEFVRDRVIGVDTRGGRVRSVQLASGRSVECGALVVAAGPALLEVGQMLGLQLPVAHELHSKVTVRDARAIVPRNAPFVIWTDPMELSGEPLPGGVHLRPVDLAHGDELYLIWTFETGAERYVWPPTFSPRYAELVLRGVARMIPRLTPHLGDMLAGAVTDGGYYCKAPDNRPLVGPLPVAGAYVVGGLSGIGLMASHACGELLSLHVGERALPAYARWFLPSRFDDADYRALVERWGPLVGQL